MKRVALATAIVLLAATGALAQQRGHHHPRPSPPTVPQAPHVPQTLSTGGITTLPAPPPPGPFDARPGTYAPRYNNALPRPYGGIGYSGGSYYDSGAGLGELVPPSEVVAPAAESVAVAPHASEPAKPAAVLEPPPVVHGPDTYYVIPGCYAGNHPPNPDRLPKGCELSKMRTHPIH
jgi:hypothetical protein